MRSSPKVASEDQPRLIALLDGQIVGVVTRDARQRYHFTYDDDWQSADDHYPLSLSMPLVAKEHGHKEVEAYLWGLLPDNERTLERYARAFGVSARNPMSLLAHIGADCAGAVQFVPPAHLAQLAGTQREPSITWLSDTDVARELRSARDPGLPSYNANTTGRFSLAGAQPKTALFRRAGSWGTPQGRTPTTHILKPPSTEYPGFAENEHLCLALVAELGLGAARSEVVAFEDEIAIAIERFDRIADGDTYRRIHQEDLCQALSVVPWQKYENAGGPGIAQVVALVRESSLEPGTDIGRFLDMIAVNWVIAGTDAHAKNYALLHVPGGGVRLAPFYDIASYLPYADQGLYKVKMAMRVGREYLVRHVGRRDWLALAEATHMRQELILERLHAILSRIPAAIERVTERAVSEGLSAGIVEPLKDAIVMRAQECIGLLDEGPAGK